MKSIRIGNDISFVWRFYTKNGCARLPYVIQDKNIKVIIADSFGTTIEPSFTKQDNEVHFSFLGKDQRIIGEYTLTLFENAGELGMKAIDKITPFRLVSKQERAIIDNGEQVCPTLDIVVLDLDSDLGQFVDYNELQNRPKINGVTLQGNKSLAELGIAASEDLVTEFQRATGAEQALAEAISAEATRAREAESDLSDAIATENQRATGAESNLNDAIEAEETRAKAKETELGTDIATESERAQGAESNLSAAIDAEETRAEAKESELGTAINTETQRAQDAEGNLSTAISTETDRATAKEGELATAISNEATRAANAESGLDTRLANVEGKIPSQASSDNQLADKSFVNSSIATETAHYIYKTNAQGDKLPFDSVAELEAYSGVITNNDYAFVAGTDSEGNSYYDKYKATDSQGAITWAKEYRLNNSSFTAAQWAAIQSGITSGLVGKLTGLPTNEALLQLLAGKANAVHTHNLSDIENIEMLSQEQMLTILNS